MTYTPEEREAISARFDAATFDEVRMLALNACTCLALAPPGYHLMGAMDLVSELTQMFREVFDEHTDTLVMLVNDLFDDANEPES